MKKAGSTVEILDIAGHNKSRVEVGPLYRVRSIDDCLSLLRDDLRHGQQFRAAVDGRQVCERIVVAADLFVDLFWKKLGFWRKVKKCCKYVFSNKAENPFFLLKHFAYL